MEWKDVASIIKRGKSYRVQIRKNGIAKCRSFPTKAEAQKWAKKIEALVDDDLIIPSTLLLKDALERYEPKGLERYIISVWLRHPLARRDMSTIKPTDIATYRDEEIRNGKAPKTIRNHVSVISQVYRLACTEWGFYRLVNPVRGVRMPPNRPGRNRRLTDDEEQRLLDAAWRDCNPWLEPAFILAIETAMRQGELLAIRWKHVNLERRYIFLPAEITKTKRNRSVPLSTKALDTLLGIQERHDCKKVIDIVKPTLIHAWERIKKDCEIDDLRWHDLRHHATSMLFEKGLTAEEVMSITGHSTYAMLARYTHIRAQDLASRLG